tara:strand:- start:181 stop:720 length:540 start_codon:yes stop_codon:yes gene_type:complete
MKKKDISSVIWITGLSASGKTTLAELITKDLIRRNLDVIMLDGDDLREILGATNNHTREDRLNLAFVYSRMALSISRQNKIVVVATVALFKEIHKWNRKNINNYFEVFLDVPMKELRARDPKGIYKRYDSGSLDNVAGLDLPIDKPIKPDLSILFDKKDSPEDNAVKVLREFLSKNILD